MLRKPSPVVCFVIAFAIVLSCGRGWAQSPKVLYTWNGTGNVQGWFKNFGTNSVTLANTVAGELTVTETGTAGTGVAISDDFNNVFEGAPGVGGLDLTGLSVIQIDMGHNGAGAVQVQFFVQASAAATFVALGPDQAISPGIKSYVLPLGGLTSAQKAYIRTIGLNIRDHVAEGNLTWTISEVRSVGPALTQRDYATFDPGSSDGGLQGAIINFDNSAVEGNDGGQNQTGLSQNSGASPPGNTGSLHWVDLGSGNGAAVSLGNGTAFGGNTFNERPTDMSNYKMIVVRVAATKRGGNAESVQLQYFLQSGGFQYHAAGPDQDLPADGRFHNLCFPIDGIPNLDFVEQHGLNLRAHPGGDLLIDIDNIRAAVGCGSPIPVLPGVSWLVLIIGLLAAGGFVLSRRMASGCASGR